MPRSSQPTNFPGRFYLPRVVGLGLGFAAVFPNLPRQPCYPELLVLLAAYCFVWPHLAYRSARASAQPARAECRNLLVDAFAAGLAAAAMGFNPIPSVAILTMVTMNDMAMGGPRFMLGGALCSALGAALGHGVLGTPFGSALTAYQIAACMPILILHPMSLAYLAHITAVKLKAQTKALRAMSNTDSLTGLSNRAAFNDILERSLRAPGAVLAGSVIALIDVDGFKQINDQHGHRAGDRALQRIAHILRACVREQDTVGRYGGDEFCVILRDVSRAEAARILERMRALAQQAVEAQDAAAEAGGARDGERSATLSIGAAAYRADAGSGALWIHLADEAMYAAKKGGRNQVVFAA